MTPFIIYIKWFGKIVDFGWMTVKGLKKFPKNYLEMISFWGQYKVWSRSWSLVNWSWTNKMLSTMNVGKTINLRSWWNYWTIHKVIKWLPDSVPDYYVIFNTYLGDFGNVRERYFWTKNPTQISESRFADFLKNLILGTEPALFSDEKINPHYENGLDFCP